MRKHIDAKSFRRDMFRSTMLNMSESEMPYDVSNDFFDAFITFRKTESAADFKNLIDCFTYDDLIKLCKAYLDRGQIYAARGILNKGLDILDEFEYENV